MNAAAPAPPRLLSYWEHQTFLGAPEVVVAGGGIVGLTAAIYTKERRPDWRVVVLERDVLPNGASTKNAGFACFGSISELIEQEKKGGPAELVRIVQARWHGLSRLRALLGDDALGYEPVGGYELFRHEEATLADECLRRLPYYNALLAPIIGSATIYRDVSLRRAEFGFAGVRTIIANAHEGALDTGRMMLALLRRAWQAGVEVQPGVAVERFAAAGGGGVQVQTSLGPLRAGQLLLATNAFVGELLPELDVLPGRNQVLVTEPLVGLPTGTFHYDRGYTYFRAVPGGRLLLGGGRNLDPSGEATTLAGLTPVIQHRLEQLLRDVILPGRSPRIDYRWSGVLAFGAALAPIIRQVQPGVVVAVRCNGMGVALGAGSGWQAAQLLTGAPPATGPAADL